MSDPVVLRRSLRELIEALPRIVPSELGSEEQWRRNGEYVYLPYVLEVIDQLAEPVGRSLREQIKKMLNGPVPPTIATDDDFRDIYAQGYRHALTDVLGLLPGAEPVGGASPLSRDCLLMKGKTQGDDVSPGRGNTLDGAVDCSISACDSRRGAGPLDSSSTGSEQAINSAVGGASPAPGWQEENARPNGAQVTEAGRGSHPLTPIKEVPETFCRECRRSMRWTSLYGDWCDVCCPRDL